GFDCTPCPAGSYSPHSDSAVCTKCPVGTYSATATATSAAACTPCPSDQYSNSLGATGCSLCGYGELPSADGTRCECQPGYVRLEAGACSDVAQGYYTATVDQLVPVGCDAGTYDHSTTASTSAVDCLDCGSGAVAAEGSSVCVACPSYAEPSPAFPSVCICSSGYEAVSLNPLLCLQTTNAASTVTDLKLTVVVDRREEVCAYIATPAFETWLYEKMKIAVEEATQLASGLTSVTVDPVHIRHSCVFNTTEYVDVLSRAMYGESHSHQAFAVAAKFTDPTPVGEQWVRKNFVSQYFTDAQTILSLGRSPCTEDCDCGRRVGSTTLGSYATPTVECTECLAGSYSSSSAAPQCLPCPIGTYSERGRGDCRQCPTGQVATSPGSGECSDCPAGYVPTSGGTACACGPGYVWESSSQTCEACGSGYYQDDPVNGMACKQCPAGTRSEQQTGSAYCVQCSDGEASPAVSGVCHACASNATESGNQRCSCPPGYRESYSDESLKAQGCLQGRCECVPCQAGQFSSVHGASECSLCAAGHYNPSSHGASALACLPCPGNRHAAQPGAGACETCPGLSLADVPATQCRCAPGSYVASGDAGSAASFTCAACPPGAYNDAYQASECLKCRTGFFSRWAGRTTVRSCMPCTPWNSVPTVAPEEGSEACLLCPSRSVNLNIFDRTSCSCAPGTFQMGYTGDHLMGMTRREAYHQLALAYDMYDPAEASALSTALLGYNCTDCREGHYNEDYGAATCSACPAGTYQDGRGAASSCDCRPCVNAAATDPASVECLPCGENAALDVSAQFCYCPYGYRKVGTSDEVAGGFSCEMCPAGAYNDVGRSNSTHFARGFECTMCPSGTYSGEPGAQAVAGCLRCGEGMYQEFEGRASCTACPANSAPYRARSSCQCYEGYYARYSDQADYVAGRESLTMYKYCVPCPKGGDCPGNDLIVGRKNYWRLHVSKLEFYACDADTCQGEAEAPLEAVTVSDLQTRCAEGHNTSVAMCGGCVNEGDEVSEKYLMGATVCEKCTDASGWMWLRVLLGLLFFVLLLVIVAAVLCRPFFAQPEENTVTKSQELTVLGALQDAFAEVATWGTLKTIITFYQILCAVASHLNVPWPSSFRSTMQVMNVVNLDFSYVKAVNCLLGEHTHYQLLLTHTVSPIAIGLCLLALHTVGQSAGQSQLTAMRSAEFTNNCWLAFTLLLYAIYPTASRTILLVRCTTRHFLRVMVSASGRLHPLISAAMVIPAGSARHFCVRWWSASQGSTPLISAAMVISGRAPAPGHFMGDGHLCRAPHRPFSHGMVISAGLHHRLWRWSPRVGSTAISAAMVRLPVAPPAISAYDHLG
ncbi:hypothetical protein CYMTET_20732, partial [Cymbomonas tetramitiformis]